MYVTTEAKESSYSDGSNPPVQDELGRRLEELIPRAGTVEADTRLGRVLLRLRAALLDAEAERQVSKAFGDGVIALVPRLRRFALLRTGNIVEADDMVRATLMRAWEQRSRFAEGTSLVAWLFTILRNIHHNKHRRVRRQILDFDGAVAAEHSAAANQQQGAAHLVLQAALDAVPMEERETLLLVTVDGLTHEEAAAVLGCPVGTVRVRVSQARYRLTLALGQ